MAAEAEVAVAVAGMPSVAGSVAAEAEVAASAVFPRSSWRRPQIVPRTLIPWAVVTDPCRDRSVHGWPTNEPDRRQGP